MNPVTRIDLHVHSKFSKQTSHWLLNRIGCPESFSEPKQLYELLKKKGMTRVTLTDHNAIEGCLEIAHLPDVFISEEVTTFFPGETCPIHLLVFNINETQHQEIQRIRENVFDLVQYLKAQSLLHVQAHPFYAVNNRLTLEHFEKTLLLFKNFELNGGRDGELNQYLRDILFNLTPEDIEQLSNRHGIPPAVPEAWKKNLVGGSDDHSLFHAAGQYTEMDGVDTLQDFLQGIEAGRARVVGRASTPHVLAHAIYSVAYQFYKNKFGLGRAAYSNIFFRFLDRSLHPSGEWPGGFFRRLYALLSFPHRLRLKNLLLQTLQDRLRLETLKILGNDPELMAMIRGCPAGSENLDRRWFKFVSGVSNKVILHYGKNLFHHASQGYILQSFQSLGSVSVLYLFISPYLVAFSNFSRDRRATIPILKRFPPPGGRQSRRSEEETIAHFTDPWMEDAGTFAGSSDFIPGPWRKKPKTAVITCDGTSHSLPEGIHNFSPIGTLALPEDAGQKLYFPPFLEMLQFCYERKFIAIHSATPGPVGLAALGIARILRLPIWGTYSPALPHIIKTYTGDGGIEALAWKFTRWYYSHMQKIYVPSAHAAQELAQRGFAPEKIRLFSRRVDLQRFHPSNRNGYLEEHLAIHGGLKLLYVGPIAKEKNLHSLGEAFRLLARSMKNLSLILVGDGPYLKELRQMMAGTPCFFINRLPEDDLPYVLACGDLFVLPATKTYSPMGCWRLKPPGFRSLSPTPDVPRNICFRKRPACCSKETTRQASFRPCKPFCSTQTGAGR